MSEHLTAASKTIDTTSQQMQTPPEPVQKKTVQVTQDDVNTPQKQNSSTSTPSSTSSSNADTSSRDDNNNANQNNKQAPQQENQSQNQQKPEPKELTVDQLKHFSGLDVDEWEKVKKNPEKYSLTVDDLSKIDKERLTTNKERKSDSGRDKAGQVKGLMPDPDWGKPLDDKFDIQQGDFIEFLMKEVVLASASWTGNKVCGLGGYALYRIGHEIHLSAKENRERHRADAEKSKKIQEDLHKKMVDEKLHPEIIKHKDSTSGYAKKILAARMGAMASIDSDQELKDAQQLSILVRSCCRGELSFDANNPNKVTRTYTEEEAGKQKTEKHSVPKETYQTLLALNKNITETLKNSTDKTTDRQLMEAEMSLLFEQQAILLKQSKVFASDYAAATAIEKASHLSSKDVNNLSASKEFKALEKEGFLAFYTHLLDIEHHKPNAIQPNGDKSAFQVLSDMGHTAAESAIKKINNGDYKEALKDKNAPINDALTPIFINGKSDYYTGYENLSEKDKTFGLSKMGRDAFEGYQREDKLQKEQMTVNQEISSLEADKDINDAKRARIEDLKKGLNNSNKAHEAETQKRDVARQATPYHLRGGNHGK